jgi:hypothetical protein
MSFLNRGSKRNAYNVIPVLFHTDCNLAGSHGTVLVSNRKLGLKNAVVDFFLKNHADAPALTPKLFLEIEAAAESQGYVLHELISYARIAMPVVQVPAKESVATQPERTSTPREYMYARDMRGAFMNHPSVTEEGIWSGTGTIHHAEAPAEMGERLLRNISKVPPQSRREPFDMHSLSNLEVPAFLRKPGGATFHEVQFADNMARKQQDAIKAFAMMWPSGWLLDPKEVDARYATWPTELREEFKIALNLSAANRIGDSLNWSQLHNQLVCLESEFQAKAEVAAQESAE